MNDHSPVPDTALTAEHRPEETAATSIQPEEAQPGPVAAAEVSTEPALSIPAESGTISAPGETLADPAVVDAAEILVSQPVEPAVEPKPARPRSAAPRWRTPLIIVLAVLVVLLLGAGGASYYYYTSLRATEARLLDESRTALESGNWAAAEASCNQLFDTQANVLFNMQANILVDPQRCLPLRGEAYYQQGKLDLALTDLLAAQARYPDPARPYYLTTLIYQQQGKNDQALAAAAEAQKRDDSLALPYTLQAVDFYQHRKMKEAEKAAQEALKRDGKQAPPLRILGNIQAWRAEDKAALENLNKAIELDPKDIVALSERAILSYYLADYKAFQADTDVVLSQNAEAPASLVLKALLAHHKYEYPESYGLINAAIKLDGTRPEYYFIRATLFPNTEKGSQSQLADLDKALEQNPDMYIAQVEKFYILESLFEKVDLLAEGERLMKVVPETGWGEMLTTHHYYQVRDWNSALDWANKFLEKRPNLPYAYLLHGEISIYNEVYDRAKSDFSKALELDPNSLSARSSMAWLLSVQNKVDDALAIRDEMVSLAPKLATPYLERSYSYSDKDEKAKARKDIDKALEIDPNNIDALIGRFFINVEEKDYTRASEDIVLIASIKPKAPTPHALKAELYLAQEDPQRALDEAKLAIELHKYNAYNFSLAAEANFKLKKYDETVYYAGEALKLDSRNDNALSWMAQAYYAKKDYDAALTYGLKAISIKKSLGWMYLLMADACVARDDYVMALQYLKSAQSYASQFKVDTVDWVEKNVKFYATIPPLVDGVRTVVDKANKFSFSYSKNWLPSPDIKKDNKEVLRITSKDSNPVIFSVLIFPITGQYTTYFTAQLFADFFRQEVTATGTNVKYTDRKPVQGAEYGIMDAYEGTVKDKDGKTFTEHGRTYFFYQTGWLIVIDVYGPANNFDPFIPEIEKTIKTLKFVN